MVEKKQNKNRHFNFRVNEKEYNKIKSQIEKSKLNTSEYLLRTAMDKDIIVVDGLEEILKVDDFSYLNKDLLDSFELKVGSVIPQSTEKGKIINNYECYLTVCMNTERALNAKVGEKISLRLSNSDEVDAEIVYVSDTTEDGKIIVFKIKDDVKELIEYRKISLDVIWWKYTGFKVSNDAIITEGDKNYVERNKAGFADKILIKIEN